MSKLKTEPKLVAKAGAKTGVKPLVKTAAKSAAKPPARTATARKALIKKVATKLAGKVGKQPETKAPATSPTPSALARPGTDAAIARLARATHDLSARRMRDMLPGRITTRRLVLRAPIRGDVPELIRLADNKAIAKWLATLPSPYTRADAIGFVEILAQRPDERPYAITLNDKLIGVLGFSFEEGKAPEIGYWLGEPHWGKGIMTEAVKGAVEAAHLHSAFETITAQVLVGNDGSLKVLEKAGFKQVKKTKGEIGNCAGKPVILLELRRPRWM
ncbi:MAG: GNAT family N-acetyltransferase [Devosia sp.]